MLKKILQEYIDNATKPMTFGKTPIVPIKKTSSPIIGMSKWVVKDGELTKTYLFTKIEQRNEFVLALISYERECQHYSTMIIEESAVTLKLLTKDLKRVTELDKEYAKYSDVIFKEVIYNSINENKLSTNNESGWSNFGE